MKEDKTKRKSMMKDFLDDIKITRRSFMKKASAATGTAVALGGMRPSLKTLSAAGEGSAGGMADTLFGRLYGGKARQIARRALGMYVLTVLIGPIQPGDQRDIGRVIGHIDPG